MTQGKVLAIAAACSFVSMPVAAQAGSIDSQCRAGTVSERFTQDACQKALDLFQFMAPQLGITIVGGNAVLGEHSSMRGLGHFSVGLRANVLESSLPQVEKRSPVISGATSSEYPVSKQVIGAPALDAAIGLFRGFPVGGTHVLGVDGLVNLAYIPSVTERDIKLEVPDGSIKLGFGGRVGVMQETFLTPGIAVTYLRRDLPTMNVIGQSGSDELRVRNIDVQTEAWRGVIGKNFSVLGLSVGGGQDRYKTSAIAQATVVRTGLSVDSDEVEARQKVTRENFFANASLNFAVLRIVGEVGRVSGGSIKTFNSFSGSDANDARNYASLGLRVNW
ncbi:MAG: hypothetical protein ABIZ91_16375 [Gemmatimonadaceae bacterium]